MALAKVLIASDDKISVRSLKASLDKIDFEFSGFVNNRTEAIKQVKETKPDILLIDTRLNDFEDGIETARYLTGRFKIPHVFFSSTDDKVTINRSKTTSPYGYLLKPVNVRDLNSCLKTALFRYQSEQKLRESEEKYIRLASQLKTQKEEYKLIFETMPAMVLVKDTTGNIIKVNKAAAKYIGYKTEEMEGMSLAAFFPQQAEQYKSEDDIVIKTKKPQLGIIEEFINRKKERKYIKYDKYPYFDLDGNITGVVVMAQDITAQKEMEVKLAEVEHKNSSLINTIPDLLFEYDKNGNYIDFRANDFNELYTEPENFLGKKVTDVLPAGISAEYLGKIKKAYSTGAIQFFEYNMQLNGKKRVYEARFVKSGSNRVLSIIRDITQKKSIEIALKESEERYRSFIEHSSEGIYRLELSETIPIDLPLDEQLEIFDKKSFIAECNDVFAKMYGLKDASEIKGLVNNVYREINRQETLRLRRNFIMNNYSLVDVETEETGLDGKQKFFLNNAHGIVENGKLTRVWGVLRDITTKKMADEALRYSLLEKEILLKEIHHRVKNNLQIVTSLLKLQGRYISDKKALKLLKDSQDRIHSMSIIHQKLYQSKDLSHIDFHDYMLTIITHLQHSYGVLEDRVKIHIAAKDIIMPIDNAVPAGLIINELVSNSLKYAFPGENKGNIFINVAYENINREFWLSVRDEGKGLPEEISINSPGTFGLTLVNLLVEQMEGTIEIVRKGGAEFRINFRNSDYKQRS